MSEIRGGLIFGEMKKDSQKKFFLMEKTYGGVVGLGGGEGDREGDGDGDGDGVLGFGFF